MAENRTYEACLTAEPSEYRAYQNKPVMPATRPTISPTKRPIEPMPDETSNKGIIARVKP